MNGFKMASAVNKIPILRPIAVRNFAAQAKPKTTGSGPAIQTSKLPNEVVVASMESASPIARVSICFNAGSRYETSENLGVTHYLRVASGLTNENSTAFGLTRHVQQAGGNLSCSNDREIIEYNVTMTRDNIETGLQYLADAATAQSFRPWEVDDTVPMVKGDVGRLTPQIRAIDLLHRAAFRRGLGNSLFCPKHHIGKLSAETLQHYAKTNFVSKRCAVVGVGIDHQTIAGFAKNLDLAADSSKNECSTVFHSGDMRVDKYGDWAHVAVAAEGAAVSNQKEALAFAILQQIAGDGIAAKRGTCNGVIGEMLSGQLANSSFGFNALNASYSDNGLFGFVLSAESKNIKKAIDVAINGFKQGSVKSEDICVGKQKLKAAVLLGLESESNLVSDLGHRALILKEVLSTDALLSAIDGVSEGDVNAAAKKIKQGPWAIGAIGNLENVPFSSDLK